MRLAWLGLLAACAHGTQETDVVFTRGTPLSRNAEIARRVLPPVTHHRIEQRPMAEQAIDLAAEKFDVYIPVGAPPAAGYGVIVFIAPWSDPTRPRVWRAALDQHHLIFVSAQRSGNGEKLLDRRLPLALLAYANIRARFPIDDRRVYVAGFSGGSRVAEIAALAYPDVFRGAILNAGADPIDGQRGMFKPPAELFRMFQRSRLVFVTGDLDTDNARQDDVTQRSLRDACVRDIATVLVAGKGHEPLDQRSWDRALDALEAPRIADPELAACNARVDAGLAAALAETDAAIARGDRETARRRIDELDARYGGLAAPAILALEAHFVQATQSGSNTAR